jgi:peptidoglycan/LPS O-acetylase OafA/YrhL
MNGEQNIGQWAASEWHRDMTDSLSGNLHHIGELMGDLLRNPAVWALVAGACTTALTEKRLPQFVANALGFMMFAAVLYGYLLLKQNGDVVPRLQAFGMLMAIMAGVYVVGALISALGSNRKKDR